MAELVESFCMQMLPETSEDFLQGLCDEYKIVVEVAKKDDKPYLLRLVLRYLTSETVENSADKGASLFLKLYSELGGELKKHGKQLKSEPSMPDLDESEDNRK